MDQQEAYFDARDWFAKRVQAVDDSAVEQFNLEHVYQLMFRQLVDPELGNPEERIFETASHVRANLSPNEAAHFINFMEEKQEEEYAGWSGQIANKTLRVIAHVVGLDSKAKPAEIVDAVTELEIQVNG